MTSRQTFQQEQQRRMLQEQERRRASAQQQQYPDPGVAAAAQAPPRSRMVAPAAPPEPQAAAPAHTISLSDEQRAAVQRYIQLDDEISQLNSEVNAKRAERKEMEDEVLAILQLLRTPLKAGNDVLKVKKSKKKEAINQGFWIKKLETCGELKDPSRAKDLVKNIYKNRNSEEEDFSVVHEKAPPAATE